MQIFIQSSEAISCRETFNQKGYWKGAFHDEDGAFRPLLHPDYKPYIQGPSLRRLSKVLRAGVASATSCLQHAGVAQPEAIVVGTGLGCLEDTTRFLSQLVENEENLLNPTPFIQSTHNTIAGQIALLLSCKGYNMTFTQKSLSFETALLDALMLMKEQEVRQVLVGGVDEFNDESRALMQQEGCLSDRFFYGEGATFFLLNTQGDASEVELAGMRLIFDQEAPAALAQNLLAFLKEQQVKPGAIDVVVSGERGSAPARGVYREVEALLPEAQVLRYKQWTGEGQTAAAQGLFFAERALKTQGVPAGVGLSTRGDKQLHYALLLNHTKKEGTSFVLLHKS